MKILFISSGQYPDGGAATNRHMAYAKGLYELGHKVEFLLLRKQKWQEKGRIIDGLSYVQCDEDGKGSKIPKLSSFIKLWRAIGIARSRLFEVVTEESKVSLILLDTQVISLIPLIRQGRKCGIKIFHERTEYPFVVSGKSLYAKINLAIYLKKVIMDFDGIFVINKALVKYFKKITNEKVPLTIINMIVDPTRFKCEKSTVSKKERVITFCGGLDGDKDGVPILISSFAHLSNNLSNIKLQLIGPLNNTETKRNLRKQIDSLNVNDKVILTGAIHRDDVPGYLCKSDILALARPSNKQAEGGFPTKLGEYLATGNPVVVTNVGEIGDFLTDGENAFVAEPDSFVKFSAKLYEALTFKKSFEIGFKGKELVYKDFHYLSQAKELERFIFKIINHE